MGLVLNNYASVTLKFIAATLLYSNPEAISESLEFMQDDDVIKKKIRIFFNVMNEF